MESFVFSEMNKASRSKDFDKIKYYGPFASALSYIIDNSNKKQVKLGKTFSVYRGLQITQEELQQRYKVGETIKLQGYTSTTL